MYRRFVSSFTSHGRADNKRYKLAENLNKRLADIVLEHIRLPKGNKRGKVIDNKISGIIDSEIEKVFNLNLAECNSLFNRLLEGKRIELSPRKAMNLAERLEKTAGSLKEMGIIWEEQIAKMPRETPNYLEEHKKIRQIRHKFGARAFELRLLFSDLADKLRKRFYGR